MAMVVMKNDDVICYSCFQNRTEGELDYWLPDDPENYPVNCERCTYVSIGPGTGHYEDDNHNLTLEEYYARRSQPVIKLEKRRGNVLLPPEYFYSPGEAFDRETELTDLGHRCSVTDITPKGV